MIQFSLTILFLFEKKYFLSISIQLTLIHMILLFIKVA